MIGPTQERITPSWLDIVLPHVREQAEPGTSQMRDWSRYDLDVVFTGRDHCRADLDECVKPTWPHRDGADFSQRRNGVRAD